MKVASVEDWTIVYHHEDHLGWWNIDLSSTWALLQVVDYLPFGEIRTKNNYWDYENKYLFGWKEQDSESDLQYFEARYYDNQIAKFESIDRVFWEVGSTKRGVWVLRDPQQLNSYAYSRNNPLIYIDPTGEICEWSSWLFCGWLAKAGEWLNSAWQYVEKVFVVALINLWPTQAYSPESEAAINEPVEVPYAGSAWYVASWIVFLSPTGKWNFADTVSDAIKGLTKWDGKREYIFSWSREAFDNLYAKLLKSKKELWQKKDDVRLRETSRWNTSEPWYTWSPTISVNKDGQQYKIRLQEKWTD